MMSRGEILLVLTTLYVTLLNSQSLDTIPQSAIDEVCSTSCWNQASSVIQNCYGEDVSVHQCCTVTDVTRSVKGC